MKKNELGKRKGKTEEAEKKKDRGCECNSVTECICKGLGWITSIMEWGRWGVEWGWTSNLTVMVTSGFYSKGKLLAGRQWLTPVILPT
jgi:hypothetical protein